MSEERNRTKSVGSIAEFLNKRKRSEKESQIEVEKGDEVFKKSKKTIRTPQKKETNPERQGEEGQAHMENLEKLIVGLSSQIKEIKEDTSSTNKAIGSINEQLKRYGEEIRVLKEEAIKKEVEWEREKAELRKEVEMMKKKLENQEKKERKNNIIIRGKDFNKENAKQEIKEFVRKEIGVEAGVEEAYRVGKSEMMMTLVKLENFEQKVEILKKKRRLGHQEIYIECDLTQEDQKVQAAIRKVAREEKKNGKRTKIGYRKILIDGISYKWSDEEGGSLKRVQDPGPKN